MRIRTAKFLRWLQWLLMLDYKFPRLLGWLAHVIDPSDTNVPIGMAVKSRW